MNLSLLFALYFTNIFLWFRYLQFLSTQVSSYYKYLWLLASQPLLRHQMASTLSSVLQQLVDITTWEKETHKQSVAQSLKTVIHMK